MKRKIVALFTVMIMVLSFTGCSKEGLSLLQETKKINKWEATQMSGDFVMDMNMAGEKMQFTMSLTGWENVKEQQGYFEIALKDITAEGEVLKDAAKELKISPIKAYVDKGNVYYSKSYFTDLFALSGTEVPKKLAAMDVEYIGFNVLPTAEIQKAGMDIEKVNQLLQDLYAKVKTQVPVKQVGRSYTIELDSNQLADLTVEFANVVLNNIDEINKCINTGTTQEEMNKQKSEFAAMLAAGKELVKPMIEGTKVKVDYNFEDDKYTNGLDMTFNVKLPQDPEAQVAPQTVNMNMTAKINASKIAKKAFELPKKVALLTVEEYMGMMMPEELTQQAVPAQVPAK